MKTTKTLFCLIIIIHSIALSQTPQDIISKAEESIKGKTSVGTFTMNITTPEFQRTFTMDAWWVGNEKALIVITNPAKEKGNKTLKIKNEMWNYLKNTETTIKIPPSMMLSSWNGSDFTNDDLVRESNLVRDYDLKIMQEEKISGELCWKIEMKPKPNVPVVWGYLYYWVRKSDFLPALIQYYDEKGELHRTMKFSDYKMMDGRKIPCKMTVSSNKKENHSTELIYSKVKFDVKINDRIFSFKELEK